MNTNKVDSSPTRVGSCGRKEDQIRVMIASLLFMLAYVAASVLPRWLNLSTPLSVGLAVVAALVFAYFIFTEVRIIRTMDEMQQRIQLEALAIAYPASILFVMLLGLLERVIELPKTDFSYRHIWPLMFFFYFLGLVIARRRYS